MKQAIHQIVDGGGTETKPECIHDGFLELAEKKTEQVLVICGIKEARKDEQHVNKK